MAAQSDRFVVIMAGGKGERFWPLSRLTRPKQLLPIVGDKPLLTQTVERIGDLVPKENILIITNTEQADTVKEVCPMLPEENIVAEPVGRDTAPAVGLALVLVKQRNPKASFAMLPADHVVHDDAGFRDVLKAAFEASEAHDSFVTIGIKPEYPATGYGYIHKGEAQGEHGGHTVYTVKQFKEKPDEATAKEYVESGDFYWNAGMFIWRVPVVQEAFQKHASSLWNGLSKIDEGLQANKPLQGLLEEVYPNLDKISVDYAIMEKAESVLVIESAFDWDDVGEWPAVARHYDADGAGNVVRGEAAVRDANGNIVINDGKHVTALLGVDDLIVVQTKDATLICPRSRSQDIKELVKQIGGNEGWQHLM